ncbi:MAG: hypothetical protein ACRDXX_07740 [Stackebrandtia sp.]
MDSRRARWKIGWGKPLLRTALLYAGGTALAAWAVLMAIAVFAEPGSGDTGGTLVAVGMIGSWIIAGTVLTVMVTNPGWLTGLAGAGTAVIAAVCGWFVYTSMPDPGLDEYIAHRHAISALAFGFGVIGGGLLVLGEMATDGKVPEPRWRPPSGLTARVAVLGTAVMLLMAAVGTPAMQEWADKANTEASQAETRPPRPATLTLEKAGDPSAAGEALGTPSGLLLVEGSGKDNPVAVSMHDAATGEERWHHRRWNREVSGEAVLSDDGSTVALPGARRDDSTLRFVTVLDVASGEVVADFEFEGVDPGRLVALTESHAVHLDGGERKLVAYDFHGDPAWRYDTPSNCSVSAVADDGAQVVAGLSCLSETRTEDRAQAQALNPETGQAEWTWEAKAKGGIPEKGLLVASDRVIVDIRSDDSTSDGLFAARKIRHDLSAVSLEDGSSLWRNKKQDLGDTYTSACAGTLQLTGTHATGSGAAAVNTEARVLLGECHQVSGSAGGSFDVSAYSLDNGAREYTGSAPLGYAPTEAEEASGWFVGLPDGRSVIVADASTNINVPDCRLYVDGPQEESKRKKLPVPEVIEDTAWCQQASLQVTPNSLAVGYHQADNGVTGSYFAVQ